MARAGMRYGRIISVIIFLVLATFGVYTFFIKPAVEENGNNTPKVSKSSSTDNDRGDVKSLTSAENGPWRQSREISEDDSRSDEVSSGSSDRFYNSVIAGRRDIVFLGTPAVTDGSHSGSVTQNAKPSQNRAISTPAQKDNRKEVAYQVKYVDENDKIIQKIDHNGAENEEVSVSAADLFGKGYELLDDDVKKIRLDGRSKEVVFRYGKSRELMTLKEFLSREVDYTHPLKYRNLDFTGDQERLEDFVVKKIYQGDKTTGIFYGTKDQANLVRTKLLNASFHGGYFRYATNIRDMIPKQVTGDKYALEIEIDYMEDIDYIKAAEKKVTEFYERYGNRQYSDIQKAKLIQDWLIKNVKLFRPLREEQVWLKNTGGVRRVHFPSSAMLDGEGVCLTYAMTYARLAERLGLDVRVVSGSSIMSNKNRPSPMIDIAKKMMENPDTTTYRADLLNHAWNLVKVDGKWYHIDVFHDLNLAENFKTGDLYMNFLQSDADMTAKDVDYEGPSGTRTITIHKIWNKNRLFPAPESLNQRAKVLPKLVD